MEKYKIIRTRIKRIEIEKNADVYDITVENNPNFFANKTLVHNCCEISLKPFGMCNLTEVNFSTVESQEDLNERVKAASFIGTLQASYTEFHYLRAKWQHVVEQEALLGISLTGLASEKIYELDFKEAVNEAKIENERLAELIDVKPAKRISCVKPSGTASLVLGTSSGIHAWHAPYYIRRLQVMKNEPIYLYLKDRLPELVEDYWERPHDTAVISIPIKAPDDAIVRNDETAIQFLDRVKYIYKNWVKPGSLKGTNTHNVSATVSVKDTEWERVGNWMWKNKRFYNGLSVLPFDGGTYKQAPFETCDVEEYDRLSQYLRKIDLTEVLEADDNTDLTGEIACAGGSSCDII